MGATSVTGVGLGDSNGKQKPDNHCGCCCGGKSTDTTPTTPVKRGCVVKHVVGSRKTYRSTRAGVGIKVC